MESAIYSNQGDEYQRLIALHWVVRLLYEDDLDWVQMEAIASPDTQERILIEDIIVSYKDRHKVYIQAKKNQPDHKAWSLSDLKKMLSNAKYQLKKDPNGRVSLYSRTPFGDLQKLKEAVNLYESFSMFNSNASGLVKNIFNDFKRILDISCKETFNILNHIIIGPHHTFEGWEEVIRNDLKQHFIKHNYAYVFLKELVTKQSARLNVLHKFIKDDLLEALAKEGLHKAPVLEEAEILEKFKTASQIGRCYDTRIGGHKIYRDEVIAVLDNIKAKKNSILVTGKKGCGKTWILLEVADQIEKANAFGLLFIKGDQFDDVYSEDELMRRLSCKHDPFILVARLAEYRHVVVIIDSLDALSLSRDQKALKIFLSFIDKLTSVENVTVVLACRDFDLEYDPQLRNRSWEVKISLPPLCFERDVKPILESWGIDVRNISENQQRLLSHPQNLKLFEKIYSKTPISSILTEFHIIKLFFEESVEKNSKLVPEVIESLQSMSNTLLKKRLLFMPRFHFNGTEETIRALSSEGVLIVDSFRDRLSFTHQALLDYLMLRSYLKEGKILLEFILEHPQLPFIRPSIRTFLFYLHSMDNKDFSREVIQILRSDKVAYHVKRLIVESLAELSPITDVELNLVKNIHVSYPNLFIRFLQRVTSPEWFDAVHPDLTKAILTKSENDSTKAAILYSLEKWMHVRPGKVVECWKYALNSPNPEIWSISRIIDTFSHWAIVGIEEVLERLLKIEKEKTGDRWIGKAISKYVDATNKGDGLLWQYITQDVPVGVISHNFFSSYEKGLHCSEHHFHKKDFLIERFKKSTWLLETAINAITDWNSRYEYHAENNGLNTVFLRDTAWEQKHHDYDTYSCDPINEFLDAIHQVLRFHAKGSTNWFFKIEPALRATKDGAIAYFMIYSYLTNPEEHTKMAYDFILRPEIFFASNLSDEVGELIQGIVPYLLPEQRENIQKIIMGRNDPDNKDENEEQPRWLLKWKYKQLSVIPKIFRLPETQAFVEKWQDSFGLWPQPPEIRGWGGTVESPISVLQMESLSEKGLLKLFNFYNDKMSGCDWFSPSEHLKGGIDEIAHVFSLCAQKNPQKYLPYMNTFWESGISKEYVYALLQGISNHICCRFGRLQKPAKIEFVEPFLDGETLAEVLLDWFDKYPKLLENGYKSSDAIYTISYVIERKDLQKKLIDYFIKMSRHPDPEKIEQKIFIQNKTELDEEDLLSISINSVRGHIADGVTTLVGRLLEKEREIPGELYKLLEQFAADPVEAVRIHVLELLPFLEHKKPEKGWYLFRKAFEKAHPALWPHAYRFLYYQYKEHFDRVSHILEQIKTEGGKHGAETWGLVSALCFLDDLITFETLIVQLNEFNQEDVWRGVVKVFTSNLKAPDSRIKCLKCLIALIKNKAFPLKLLNTIAQVFEQIPISDDESIRDFLDLFLDKIPLSDERYLIYHFFDYLSKISGIFSEWCMEMVEKYLKNISDKVPPHMWKAEGLVTATIQLLRWADTGDNQGLIERVIAIQDRLLELGWPGIDEAITRAERE
ncbi:MAG TPA: AAA family ATPase [Candidatus Wunengus sp. YC60]|uniref:AAA family ATPase n=1 Tax=Candidatus Wunengus sp. YC60 TaxID=3367697 RepID=UPI0040265009